VRIAFTGAGSTGKTTLARAITLDTRLAAAIGPFVTTDARAILAASGHTGVDGMSAVERLRFQHSYLDRKLALEVGRDEYFTDRSFVDLAAYWLEYTGGSLPTEDEYVKRCKQAVTRYNAHIYFPVGLLPLELDGWRSTDSESRARTDRNIRAILKDWGISPIVLDTLDLATRLSRVAKLLPPEAL
jgi:nicotinamide riboside kinase